MLCLNNSLSGFGIVKLLIEEDLKIRELLGCRFKHILDIYWCFWNIHLKHKFCFPEEYAFINS